MIKKAIPPQQARQLQAEQRLPSFFAAGAIIAQTAIKLAKVMYALQMKMPKRKRFHPLVVSVRKASHSTISSVLSTQQAVYRPLLLSK